MKLNRRIFLSILGATGAGVGAIVGVSRHNKTNTVIATEEVAKPLDSLSAIIDTLIPADQTPGALDIGIDQIIKDKGEQDPKWRTRNALLVKSANEFAQQYFQKSFVELNQDNKETVLHMVFSFKHISDQTQLLEHLTFKQEVMSLFYNSETGHKALAYTPPYRYPSYGK
jgi:hypothetical protein